MLLEVDNVRVYYGRIEALKGISFHVDEGEVVTLIGANGAGKSTTLRMLSGVRNTSASGGCCSMARTSPGCPLTSARRSGSASRRRAAASSRG